MTRELNKVDLIIKRSMLKYPMLYPNRFSVLSSLFCLNGNGFEWNEHGEIVSCFEEETSAMPDRIELSDLDKRINGVDKASSLHSLRELEGKKQAVIRLFTEANIDELCKTNLPSDEIRFTSIYPVSKGYCLMDTAPTMIDENWKMALLETADAIIKSAVDEKIGARFDWDSDSTRTADLSKVKNESYVSILEICLEAWNRFDDKEARSRVNLRLKELIDKVIQEAEEEIKNPEAVFD